MSDNYYGNTNKSIAEIEPQIIGIIVKWGRETKKFRDLNEIKAWIEI